MGSISDAMLACGAVANVAALHGEAVTVLTGPLAGQGYAAVREIEPDAVLNANGQIDPRAKRVLRFVAGTAPGLTSSDIIQTGDGLKWRAVRRPDTGYLTVDFELIEVIAKDA
jgi:hypothetical protein